MLHAKIKNFSYIKSCTKSWGENLERYDFDNINNLPSKCIVNFENKNFAISKWVSPKLTRSYPYIRVYDAFSSGTNKVLTIIPLIKDEGINGDRDYLQWDSLSLMSIFASNLVSLQIIINQLENLPALAQKAKNAYMDI